MPTGVYTRKLRTHCKHGHEYVNNTMWCMVNGAMVRKCIKCVNSKKRSVAIQYPLQTTDVTRFHSHINIYEECHMWVGNKNSDGYGKFWVCGGYVLAHRYAYTILGGIIGDDKVIDHTCRNRACVNPKHLCVVSRRENALHNSNSNAALNSVKTHCTNGHEFMSQNIRIRSGRTIRFCRICKNNEKKRRRSVN